MVHWTSKKTALLSTCILRDEKKLSTYEMKMDKVFFEEKSLVPRDCVDENQT